MENLRISINPICLQDLKSYNYQDNIPRCGLMSFKITQKVDVSSAANNEDVH